MAQRARPLAASAAENGRRQLLRTRAWAAPQVARFGQVLEKSVAPRIAAMLARASRRLDPSSSGRQRWRKPASIATVTAAASAAGAAAAGGAAAVLRGRRRPTTSAADTVAATMPNGQPDSRQPDSRQPDSRQPDSRQPDGSTSADRQSR